jgi:hypothetical protein
MIININHGRAPYSWYILKHRHSLQHKVSAHFLRPTWTPYTKRNYSKVRSKMQTHKHTHTHTHTHRGREREGGGRKGGRERERERDGQHDRVRTIRWQSTAQSCCSISNIHIGLQPLRNISWMDRIMPDRGRLKKQMCATMTMSNCSWLHQKNNFIRQTIVEWAEAYAFRLYSSCFEALP